MLSGVTRRCAAEGGGRSFPCGLEETRISNVSISAPFEPPLKRGKFREFSDMMFGGAFLGGGSARMRALRTVAAMVMVAELVKENCVHKVAEVHQAGPANESFIVFDGNDGSMHFEEVDVAGAVKSPFREWQGVQTNDVFVV